MVMRALLTATVIAGGAIVGSCTVDGDFLDHDLFPCAGPSDCGPDWGCLRATPYAEDFCAPDCSVYACDGVCSEQDGRSLCLRGCRILEDGTTSECPGKGFVCIRTSAERDDGICYPVTACDSSAECLPEEVCLTDFVDLAPDASASRYYCAPRSSVTCPPRTTPVVIGESVDLCLATCDPPDTRCPPGFGCLEQAAVFSDDAVLCFPGLYGVPCDDDTNCLLGRCTDTGAGSQCTVTCDEAGRLAGGCGGLLSLASVVEALAFECDPTAGEEGQLPREGGGLCVTRSSIGFVCTTPESDAYVCQDGLDCRTFPTASGEVRLCTRDCAVDTQCNGPGAETAFCSTGSGGGLCLPKGAAGSRCERNHECLSGVCEAQICTEDSA